VLVSALGQRGVHTVPGLLSGSLFGIEDQPPGDAYAARVLGAIYAAGLEAHGRAPGLLVDYSQLPGAAWEAVAAHFGIAPTEAEIERLTAASGRNPKQGDQPFEGDAEAKRLSAPENLRALAEQWMRPAYERLERARLG
jgi:hypothetical protein